MLTTDKKIFGRKIEATSLLEKGWDIQHPRDCPRVVLLHGPPGSGKRTLLELISRQLWEEPGAYPAALFSNLHFKYPGRVETAARILLESGISPRFPQVRPTFPKLPAPEAIRGSRPLPPLYQQAEFASLPEQEPTGSHGYESLTRHFLDGLLPWVKSIPLPVPAARFRIIFLLADFDQFPAAFQTWVGTSLARALNQNVELPPQVYLLSGMESWEEGKQADPWMLPPAAFTQSPIQPLGREACAEWLMACGRPVENADHLLEETDGMPGRIAELLNGSFTPDISTEDTTDNWDRLSARQRRWLHAAALLEPVSLEGLSVILGRTEGSSAFDWLYRKAALPGLSAFPLDGQSRISITEQARRQIIERSGQKVPILHQSFKERARLHAEVRRKVPAADARARLRQLVALQPFVVSTIQEILPPHE
ncbi:hypothetical protein H5P28_12045 [Ruficoccus amylovorans]|uniref:Uncharacterized protein n=1 Tax=Ruficoccus amylovorans TaxID=1804625 RepID=A0A842HFE5_9BACT|nr:hypothetical protein [Ruficoccus amylovorans]MBC2594989.1 hypothetical protein [Ruficoccus amylovorans]